MKIAGLQKLTLLDYPAHTACTIFLWGCNFRCPFCHNAGLVTQPPAEEIPTGELLRFLNKRQGLLDGVCITGGEPTLHAELPDLIRQIRALGYQIKLDTNGTNPQMLRSLCAEGLLDMVAMDIKNAPEKYAATAGTESLHIEQINESIRFLMQGSVPFEFRTTVVRHYHTAADFVRIGKWIQGAEHYYLQGFRDSGNLIAEHMCGVSAAEMYEMLNAVLPFVPNAKLRGVDESEQNK